MSVKTADGQNATNIDSVPLKQLIKMTHQLNQTLSDKETPISFEYICASLFPTIYENIQTTLMDKYIEGYNEGKKK